MVAIKLCNLLDIGKSGKYIKKDMRKKIQMGYFPNDRHKHIHIQKIPSTLFDGWVKCDNKQKEKKNRVKAAIAAEQNVYTYIHFINK